MPETLTLPVENPALVSEPIPEKISAPRTPSFYWIQSLLLGLTVLFFALHLVHLRADFPNHSFWMDWAKYTDEGWYGDAAIRHYQLGHWNVPGDFNPAAALPVWPALELVLFRFTGVSVIAARSLSVMVFGATLLCLYVLLRRWQYLSRPLAPAVTVLLLATSPFCYVFSRLAILEPLLILLATLGLLLATSAGRASQNERVAGWRISRRTLILSSLLGLTVCLMVLTKTTAIFLLPATAWMLWAASGYRLRPFVRAAVPAAATCALLWLAYYAFFVHPHFVADYRYLFSANSYTAFEWKTLHTLLYNTLSDGIWLGKPTFYLALLAIAAAIFRIARRGLKRSPLLVTLLLWVIGYGAFLTYHANLQPRYYLVLAPPMTALVALTFDRVVEFFHEPAAAPCSTFAMVRLRARRIAGLMATSLAIAAITYTAGRAAGHTLWFVLHPEYTWVSAAEQVRSVVEREAVASGHPRLVFSISGSEMSLINGIPSICDDFGTLAIGERVAKYRPGWFAAWNDVEDDKMEALAPLYHVERVLSVPAFDDPERNLLILYRLDPLASPGAVSRQKSRRRPVSVPRPLRTPSPDPPPQKPAQSAPLPPISH